MKVVVQSITTTFCNLQLNDNNNNKDNGHANSNSIIDKSNLIELMKNTICINYRQ